MSAHSRLPAATASFRLQGRSFFGSRSTDPPLVIMKLFCTAGSIALVAMCSWDITLADQSCDPDNGVVEPCNGSPVVPTESGLVQGFDRKAEGTAVSTFWGLPFAQPPVNDLRFKYPEAYKGRWQGIRSARKQSSMCFQGSGSEDCLYLNVYTPRDSVGNATLLPVMFWIYGGGYTSGDAYEDIVISPLYDGANLAGRHRVVIVTSNYRVDSLGFNTWTQGPHGETGNQGIADQRLAMKWTHDNIRAFGGDPSQVTIFGESAGAFSVVSHLVSPASFPYYSKAIVESGTSWLNWFFQPKDLAKGMFDGWAEAYGCLPGEEQLACLQALPPADFVRPPAKIRPVPPVYPHFRVGPVVDGNDFGIPDLPLTLIRTGKAKKVPLMLGANVDGGSIFEPALASVISDLHHLFARSQSDVDKILNWIFTEEDHVKVNSVYSVSEYKGLGRYRRMVSRMMRDMAFQCSDRAVASSWASQGLDAYLYTFSFNLGEIDKVIQLGTFHASELVFVFKNYLWLAKLIPFAGKAQRTSDIMSCQWSSFAYTGNPNGGEDRSKWPPNCESVHGKVPQWPRFDAVSRNYYSLKSKPETKQIRPDNKYPDDEFPSDVKCNMWDNVTFVWEEKPQLLSPIFV